MSAGVLTAAGHKYAAGLYWQPSDERNAAKAARTAAKQPGFQADFFCTRPPTKAQPVGQFGLGFSTAGHRSGMPSIAGCLASQMPGSWAGAFRVNEGVYFVCVRDDLVDADGDALFAHDDDAHARLEQEISRGGLSNIYCPSEWGVVGSENVGMNSILTGRRDVTLSDVGIPKSLLYVTLGVLIIGGIAYGGYSYYDHLEQKRIAEEAAALQARLDAQKSAIGPAQYPKVWQDAPLPMQYLRACSEAMETIPGAEIGWRVTDISCTGTNLIVNWNRDAGKHSELPGDGKATIAPTLNNASTTVALTGLEPRGEETLAYFGLIDQVALQKNWPASLSILPDDVVQVEENQPPPPPPAWRKRSIAYTVSGAPWLRADLFENVPGLIITSVKSQSNSNFIVEGIIYENKQPE